MVLLSAVMAIFNNFRPPSWPVSLFSSYVMIFSCHNSPSYCLGYPPSWCSCFLGFRIWFLEFWTWAIKTSNNCGRRTASCTIDNIYVSPANENFSCLGLVRRMNHYAPPYGLKLQRTIKKQKSPPQYITKKLCIKDGILNLAVPPWLFNHF